MTNLVVWRRSAAIGPEILKAPAGASISEYKDPQIWIAADTRVTDPSKISDQATKILSLRATTHRYILGHGYQAYLTLQIGFAYTGAVFPALMTHAALRVLLGSLGPGGAPLPTLEQIAKLSANIAEKYVRETSKAFYKVPHCQIVLVGMSKFEGEQAAFLIGPMQYYPDFKYTTRSLLLDEVHVFGDKADSLKDEIAQLMALKDSTLLGLEPTVALASRIKANKHLTVGGSVQHGVLASGKFTVYALEKQLNRTFLGFEIQELEEELGFKILIDALMR